MLSRGALLKDMGYPLSVPAGTRKEQVFAFICEYILSNGSSPSMLQIAAAFGFTRQRAKALVDILTEEKLIHRLPGSQRAISVPGLQRQQLLAALRQFGVKVDTDFIFDDTRPLPQSNLPLVAIIEHVADDDRSQSPS